MKHQNPLPLAPLQQVPIDAWADIYTKAYIAELLAISLSEFQTDPLCYLAQAGQNTALIAITHGFRPLLPAQVLASQRIQKQWKDQDHAECLEQAAIHTQTTHS